MRGAARAGALALAASGLLGAALVAAPAGHGRRPTAREPMRS